MKEKKALGLAILALLLLAAVAACLYLTSRPEIPADTLLVVRDGGEELLSLSSLEPRDFSGLVVNGKGEEKSVSVRGVPLSEITGAAGFQEVTVTADDSYSAVIQAEEVDRAWLEIQEGEVRLYVFGDENAKRDVKQVVRIDIR